MPTAVLRIANVFGPRGHGVINIFLKRVLKNKPLFVYGDGEQTRDYIHVDDVVEALLKIMDSRVDDVYNIGTGKADPGKPDYRCYRGSRWKEG